jgi:hypothetical protein
MCCSTVEIDSKRGGAQSRLITTPPPLQSSGHGATTAEPLLSVRGLVKPCRSARCGLTDASSRWCSSTLLLAQPAPQNSRHHRRAARQLQCLQRPGARKPNRGAGPQGGFCGASIPAARTPSRAAPRRNRRCARCCQAITSLAICAMCRPTCSRKPRPYRRKCLEPFPDSSEKTRLGARKSLLLFKKIFKLKTYRRFG